MKETDSLLDIICTVYDKTRKLTSCNSIPTQDNIAMNIDIHEAVVEEKEEDLLHQFPSEEREDGGSRSLVIYIHVEVLYLIWKL